MQTLINERDNEHCFDLDQLPVQLVRHVQQEHPNGLKIDLGLEATITKDSRLHVEKGVQGGSSERASARIPVASYG